MVSKVQDYQNTHSQAFDRVGKQVISPTVSQSIIAKKNYFKVPRFFNRGYVKEMNSGGWGEGGIAKERGE